MSRLIVCSITSLSRFISYGTNSFSVANFAKILVVLNMLLETVFEVNQVLHYSFRKTILSEFQNLILAMKYSKHTMFVSLAVLLRWKDALQKFKWSTNF